MTMVDTMTDMEMGFSLEGSMTNGCELVLHVIRGMSMLWSKQGYKYKDSPLWLRPSVSDLPEVLRI